MNNILVTGSKGQLGSEIRAISKEYDNYYFFTDKNELDITNHDSLKTFIVDNDINVIINCAAYTAVDKAEDDEHTANMINHIAVKNLAEIAKEKNIKLVHISTDYVFNGRNFRPYIEKDEVNPNSVYGQTKLDGEIALQRVNPINTIIIRTSWVYSGYGANFVKTMLRLGREKDELGVIFDQVGTPTYAKDLAKTILEILPKVDNDKVEIYNYSNEGVLSWFDFAKEIMKMAKLDCKVNPIETKEYPTPAKRPHFSLLNKSKIKKEFNITIPYWKDSLAECLKIMGERN
jgi:dTDP-4-dehydrorhamnose reductase